MNFIVVWHFHDAPKVYRDYSPHGGDEDWIAFVPANFKGGQPGWMQSGTAFGCCDVSEHDVLGGKIYIGAHA